jgi:hypothetical protein
VVMITVLIVFSCVALISVTIMCASVALYCYARNFREDSEFKDLKLKAATNSSQHWELFDAKHRAGFERDYRLVAGSEGGA